MIIDNQTNLMQGMCPLKINAVIYKAQVKIKVGLSGIGVEIKIGIEIEPVQRRRAF